MPDCMVDLRDFSRADSGGSARGGWPLRGYVIGKDCQATEIDTANAAGRFTASLADGANLALAEAIQTWLSEPTDAGGLRTLAESGRDIASLRTEITALWRAPQQRVPDGREAR
jgi:hypothetical protein